MKSTTGISFLTAALIAVSPTLYGQSLSTDATGDQTRAEPVSDRPPALVVDPDSTGHVPSGVNPLPVSLEAPSANRAQRSSLTTVKLRPDEITEESAPAASNAPQPVQPEPGPVTPPVIIGEAVQQRVDQALEMATRGNIDVAITLCDALAREQVNTAERRRALECARFDVPLMSLRDHMTNDRMQAAHRLVTQMLRDLPRDSAYRSYLKSVRQTTAAHARTADPDSPGAVVVQRVMGALERFHAATGAYPRNYPELNRILPADAPPLVDYDIVNYAGGKDGFSIEIRNRAIPDEVHSLHKSALLDN